MSQATNPGGSHSRVAATALGRNITKQGKTVAGSVVHYAYGWIGVELSPPVSRASGCLFRFVLPLAADQVTVPAFGIPRPTSDYPAFQPPFRAGRTAVYRMIRELAGLALQGAQSTR